MELHQALKLIADTEGFSVLSEKRLLNILNDLQAFGEMPSSRFIISSMINEGFIKSVVDIGERGAELQKALNAFNNKTGFSEVQTKYINSCLEYAIGLIN